MVKSKKAIFRVERTKRWYFRFEFAIFACGPSLDSTYECVPQEKIKKTNPFSLHFSKHQFWPFWFSKAKMAWILDMSHFPERYGPETGFRNKQTVPCPSIVKGFKRLHPIFPRRFRFWPKMNMCTFWTVFPIFCHFHFPVKKPLKYAPKMFFSYTPPIFHVFWPFFGFFIFWPFLAKLDPCKMVIFWSA